VGPGMVSLVGILAVAVGRVVSVAVSMAGAKEGSWLGVESRTGGSSVGEAGEEAGTKVLHARTVS
jgi:hypothetical protein